MNKRFTKLAAAFAAAAAIAGLPGCGTPANNAAVPVPPATCVSSLLIPPISPGSHDGPITPIEFECPNTRYQDDLDASIPGSGIAIGGDSVPGYPQLYMPGVYNGDNPLVVPKGSRPLPTGTAVGPHGEQYAFYAVIPLVPGAGFISADTVIVDLAHPETPIFTLYGLSQASAAYDAQSGRMIVMGNNGKYGDRALWQSAPVSENAAWYSTLQPLGTFSGPMNGGRESQIVTLPKGGFLVVGAGDARAIMAVTATTPEGLLTAKPAPIVSSQTLPQVYGPTITDIQEINGKEVVTLRVSTYGIVGPGVDHYDPHTYTTTFPITRTDSASKRAIPTIAPRI